MRAAALIPLLAVLAAPGAAAQSIEENCTYRACAYNIVPLLRGLRVVRGENEQPVATLGFLWTRDISGVFDAAAQNAARRAVRTRRVAALLTDAGFALAIAGSARAASRDLDRTAANLMIAGVGFVGLSVPIQFRADRHLSRAVWLHNTRFAR